jgi:hypothetical protein
MFFFMLLLGGLAFDTQGRDRARLKPLERNIILTAFTYAVSTAFNPFLCFFDLA